MMFPFFAGLLLCRTARLMQIKNAFFWSSLLLIVMSRTRIGGHGACVDERLYESFTIIVAFPVIVYMAQAATSPASSRSKVCKFFATSRNPIYITHYPLIYMVYRSG